MQNIFDAEERDALLARVDALTPETSAVWGTMTPAQMLAHNSLVFEGALNDTYPRMNAFMRWVADKLIRGMVVGDKPYKKNMRTIPQWVVKDDLDLQAEKDRIANNIRKVHELGVAHFEGKDNPTFGPLTAREWNTVFAKHLDHHLRQFGV